MKKWKAILFGTMLTLSLCTFTACGTEVNNADETVDEKNKDEKDNNGKYVHRERYTGQCSRSFYVGKDLEHEDIRAKYDNGVLTITFPKEAKKKEPEEKKFISIEG